jgi:ketosteroid isomerase-like protein
MAENILTLEKSAMERWRSGDTFGFVELSAEDLIYIDPGLTKPILGLDEYREYMKQVEGKIHYQKSEFIDPKVVLAGEAALLSYNYRSSQLAPDGHIISQTPWNSTEVYFKQAGGWKIAHTHWSFIKHRAPDELDIQLPVKSNPMEYEGVLGEVMQLESAAMERWRKGDPWGFIDLSAPDVTYFDIGTPQRLNSRQALNAEYKLREGKIFYDVMDFIDPRVQVCGEMAVLFYRFLSTWLNPDGSVLKRTAWNCSEVYRRTGSSWKIIHSHWSHIRGERLGVERSD